MDSDKMLVVMGGIVALSVVLGVILFIFKT